MTKKHYILFGAALVIALALGTLLQRKHDNDIDKYKPKATRLDSFCRVTKNTLATLSQNASKGTKELMAKGFIEDRINFGPSSVRLCLSKMPDLDPCGMFDEECIFNQIELYHKELDKLY